MSGATESSPGGPVPVSARANPDFLLLSGLVVLINLPYFGSQFIPGHDTKHTFGMFSYFYNHAAQEYELPRWMAYGVFGIKAGPCQFSFLSAVSYLAILIGALFGIQNPLAVFTASILGEQLLFLLGVYLCSRRFFTDRLTVLLVGLGAACSTVWYWQLILNFRVFHLLPLAIYFLVRFSEDRRPEFFWLSGVTLLGSGLGCPPYVYPMLALTLFVVAVGLLPLSRETFRPLANRTWQNALGFTGLLLLVASVGLTLHQALEGVHVNASDRDPATGAVTLQTFLTYGGTSTPHLLASIAGALPHFAPGMERELTHYVGLLPLAALPVALARCRNRIFLSLSAAGGILLLLSLGGTFAALVYGLPGMGFFRHIGALSTLAKVLLLLASGFGIEILLTGLSGGLTADRRTRFGLLAVVLFVGWLILDLQVGGEKIPPLLAALREEALRSDAVATAFYTALRMLSWIGAAAIVLWPSRTEPGASAFNARAARLALLLAGIVDVLLFQALVVSRAPTTSDPLSFRVRALDYAERRDLAADPRTESTMRQWRESGSPGVEYHLPTCSLFQLDPSKTSTRCDLYSHGVMTLRATRAAIPGDADLPAMLGITAPKLRLVSKAVYADSEEEARRLVAEPRGLDSTVVLHGVPPDLRFVRSSPCEGAVKVKEYAANRLTADVDVRGEGPAWLVYADSQHPGWSATINDKPAPIFGAYLAFKAVRVEKGMNVVRFHFHDGLRTVGAQALAALSCLFAAAAFALLGWTFRAPPTAPRSARP